MSNEYYNKITKLAYYTNSAAVNNNYMSFSEGVVANGILGTALSLGGTGFSKLMELKKPKMEVARQKVKLRSEIRALKDTNPLKTYKNAWRYQTIKSLETKLPPQTTFNLAEYNALDPSKQVKYRQAVTKSNIYTDARKLLDEAKTLRGSAQAKKLKEYEQALAKANLKAYKAKFNGPLKPSGIAGKTGNALKTWTGIRGVNTGIKTLAANSSKFRCLTKFIKGNAAMTAISVAMDYGKFQETEKIVGKKARNIEIAKSTGVALVESVGFLAGMKAGAALGASIGTVFPGAGNIVGGIAGAVIGGLVSWGAGKVAHMAMGKSEIEKYNEQQAYLTSAKAKYDDQTVKKLLINSEQKIAADTMIAEATPEQRAEAGVEDVDKEQLEAAKSNFSNVYENYLNLHPELRQLMTQDEQTQTSQSSQDKKDDSADNSVQKANAKTQDTDKPSQNNVSAQNTQTREVQTKRENPLKTKADEFIASVKGSGISSSQQIPNMYNNMFLMGTNGLV